MTSLVSISFPLNETTIVVSIEAKTLQISGVEPAMEPLSLLGSDSKVEIGIEGPDGEEMYTVSQPGPSNLQSNIHLPVDQINEFNIAGGFGTIDIRDFRIHYQFDLRNCPIQIYFELDALIICAQELQPPCLEVTRTPIFEPLPFEAPLPPPPVYYRSLSDSEGAIDEILLIDFLRHSSDTEEVTALFQEILSGFPIHIEVTLILLCSTQMTESEMAIHSEEIRQQLSEVRELGNGQTVTRIVRVAPIRQDNSDQDLYRTIYAQDPFVVLRGGGVRSVLLNSREGACFSEYAAIAEKVVELQPNLFESYSLPIAVQAGNILQSDLLFLMGGDISISNGVNSSTQFNSLVDYFNQLVPHGYTLIDRFNDSFNTPYSNEYPLAGGITQPLFHIDLYLTLGGNHQGRQLLFVGQLEWTETPSMSEEQKSSLQSLATQLDNTYERLNSPQQVSLPLSLEVVRLPLVFEPLDDARGGFVSFNNCLMETRQGFKRVYLADYASEDPKWADAQRRASEIYERYGFEVHLVSGQFSAQIKNLAGLRCMVKVLRRS